jgi:hypothetical protein
MTTSSSVMVSSSPHNELTVGLSNLWTDLEGHMDPVNPSAHDSHGASARWRYVNDTLIIIYVDPMQLHLRAIFDEFAVSIVL